MLGRSTASLSPVPQRWIERTWGISDIHARQKWQAVWPRLARLPESGLHLIDAGCGTGAWTLEMASRRPRWRLTGVDKEQALIEHAGRKKPRLGLSNVEFLAADFLAFEPPQPADVVLSVASAHYLVRAGRGEELFRRFGEWLRPGGLLVLYGPRACPERPLLPVLKPVGGEWGFRAENLDSLARAGGLGVTALLPDVEAFGAAAKQISSTFGTHRIGRVLTYPLQVALSAIGGCRRAAGGRSVAYLLIATKASPDGDAGSRDRHEFKHIDTGILSR